MRRFAALLAVAVCLPAAIATSGASAAGCPNEAVRVGPSALLPACQAYEMVSPLDKSGGSINNVFGILIGSGLWMEGIPNDGLWGLMAMLFRFVPYVGVPIANAEPMPDLLAASLPPPPRPEN